PARHRPRVSELRPLPPPHRVRERGVRAPAAAVGGRGHRRSRPRDPRAGRARRARITPALPALRRSAAARGGGTLPRAPAAAAAARRAALEPRLQAPGPDARRAAAPAATAPQDDDLCHPRPGGGPGAVRPHRGPVARPDSPDRDAGRDLRGAPQCLRRRLHRLLEPPRGAARGQRPERGHPGPRPRPRARLGPRPRSRRRSRPRRRRGPPASRAGAPSAPDGLAPADTNAFPATITEITYLGENLELALEIPGGGRLLASLKAGAVDVDLGRGAAVLACVAPRDVRLLPAIEPEPLA